MRPIVDMVKRGDQSEVIVTIASFDEISRSYRVLYRGVEVGPVWSLSKTRHAVGATVAAIVRDSQVVGVA